MQRLVKSVALVEVQTTDGKVFTKNIPAKTEKEARAKMFAELDTIPMRVTVLEMRSMIAKVPDEVFYQCAEFVEPMKELREEI